MSDIAKIMGFKNEITQMINKVSHCAISTDDAIEEMIKIYDKNQIQFAEWLRENCYDTGNNWLYQEDDETYTSLEILEVFKNLPNE